MWPRVTRFHVTINNSIQFIRSQGWLNKTFIKKIPCRPLYDGSSIKNSISRLNNINSTIDRPQLYLNKHVFIRNYSSSNSKQWYTKVNPDNVSAVISWVLMSHALWIALSTTTFVSGLLYLISSTKSGQNWISLKLSSYLSQSTGIAILFEQAKLKHNWTHGTIQCHNLYLSRRPQVSATATATATTTTTTTSSAEVPQDYDKDRNDIIQRVKWALNDNILVQLDHFDDGDYTQFDLVIDSCEVSLSFWKWLNGKGIIEDISFSGVRGIIDRTHLKPVLDQNSAVDVTLPKYKRRPGDFEIDKFKISDLLVIVYQPNRFRPFPVSIFHCQLPKLRKQWLLYDLINGDSISGTFDDSLFVLQRQLTSSHFRIDKLNIDHLNAGTVGPFGWITHGVVDIETNIKFSKMGVITDDNNSTTNTNNHANNNQDHTDEGSINFDVKLQLKDLKAEIPFFKNQFMTYKNKALVKPIVGYINSHKTYIPIQCFLQKPMEDFDGSWTIYDSNLVQDLSWKCWDAFATYVNDEEQRTLRIKKVTIWSAQLFIQVILMALGSIAV